VTSAARAAPLHHLTLAGPAPRSRALCLALAVVALAPLVGRHTSISGARSIVHAMVAQS